MAGERHGSRLLRALAALTAAVFFARALVPAGYMLTPVGGGAAIVFCDGHEVSAAPAHHDHMAAHAAKHSEHGKQQQHDGVCAFAASADVSNTGIAATPVFVTLQPFVVEAPIAIGNPRLELAAPPPPARGPPLSV